jgi:hypothetical protein
MIPGTNTAPVALRASRSSHGVSVVVQKAALSALPHRDHDGSSVGVREVRLDVDLRAAFLVLRVLECRPDWALPCPPDECGPGGPPTLARHDVERVGEHESLVGSCSEHCGRSLTAARSPDVAARRRVRASRRNESSCRSSAITAPLGAPAGPARWDAEGRRWRSDVDETSRWETLPADRARARATADSTSGSQVGSAST